MESLTTKEAFEAMRSFVAQFAERVPEEAREPFRDLLRWSEIDDDGVTFDPAQWDDWQKAATEARNRLSMGRSLTIP